MPKNALSGMVTRGADFVTLNKVRALRGHEGRKIVDCPHVFGGKLEEFYRNHVEPNLPRPDIVQRIHDSLKAYCLTDSPLFLIRASSATRREEYTTSDGTRMLVSDNTPALWMHYLSFNGLVISPDDLEGALRLAPAHFHDRDKRLPKGGHANSSGWYVAHIHRAATGRAGTRQENFMQWKRDVIVRRFVRLLHPCNIFLTPLEEREEFGEDPAFILYFAKQYALRYGDTWREFLEMAHGRAYTTDFGDCMVEYDHRRVITL